MPLPPVEEKKFTEGYGKLKICVTGAGGFIASHLARRLKAEGHYVRGVDWKENEYMKPEDFCDEFLNLDLRHIENCKKAVEGMEWCFNLAADMGGMGFIQSNHSRILYNSTMISFNVSKALLEHDGFWRLLLARDQCATGACSKAPGAWSLCA
mmetsp:Transcript_32850/g.63238  ORF Transcript_32850/g.63238 Transcript_32850/m.63238 type:complete len:153 (-) Transcript_32850:42-500(-)